MIKNGGKTFAVIAAGGNSTRFGQDKMFLRLNGKPVIQYSIEAFRKAAVNEIIIVAGKRNINEISAFGERVVLGGESRSESVRNGVNAIREQDGVVVIHDGARPLVTPGLIERVIAAAREYGAAVAAVKIRDTVKEAGGGFVVKTLDREKLYAAQTPQAFDLRKYREAGAFETTDDGMLFEITGAKVKIVDGSYGNIKITSPEDIAAAEGLFKNGTY